MTGNIELLAQTQAFPGEISELLGIQFFSYVLPWLLTFAIVYGVLSNIREGLPESKSARTIIGVVLAFAITPALSPYITSLMEFSAGFIVLVSGFLVFVILVEVLGIQGEEEVKIQDKQGNTRKVKQPKPIFEAYPKLFSIIIGLLALLVFIGSGTHEAMGVELPTGLTRNYPLLFFLGFMVLVVWWMVSEE